jgi:phosphoribosylaminoimidazole-succinocarboxamide synthase
MQANTIEVKEGKAKKLFFDPSTPDICEIEFKDSITALNGQQKEELTGKGSLNASISGRLFGFLNSQKINTHYIKSVSTNKLQAKVLQMIPLEVIVRNYAAGSFCKRLAIIEGKKLQSPIVQFHLKNDDLNDPLLTENEIGELEIVSKEVLNNIKNQALVINWLLSALFQEVGICLADFKLEFGFDNEGNLTLGDELSPDNMRLWKDHIPGKEIERLDKDRYRKGLGAVLENYKVVFEKITQALHGDIKPKKTPATVNLRIQPQPGLLDPTGRTLTDATNRLGFNEVLSIRAGKSLEIKLKDYRVNLIEELCERILVSPASETYDYEITPNT